jgi:hypothetical protein
MLKVRCTVFGTREVVLRSPCILCGTRGLRLLRSLMLTEKHKSLSVSIKRLKNSRKLTHKLKTVTVTEVSSKMHLLGIFIIIIISLLMSPLLRHTHLPNDSTARRTAHNPPRGPSADWWVLTTANTAGTNGLTCLPKHGGARDIKFLVKFLA